MFARFREQGGVGSTAEAHWSIKLLPFITSLLGTLSVSWITSDTSGDCIARILHPKRALASLGFLYFASFLCLECFIFLGVSAILAETEAARGVYRILTIFLLASEGSGV